MYTAVAVSTVTFAEKDLTHSDKGMPHCDNTMQMRQSASSCSIVKPSIRGRYGACRFDLCYMREDDGTSCTLGPPVDSALQYMFLPERSRQWKFEITFFKYIL